MTELYPEFYNDVFGPLMQPGSSSHMAAPCRAGLLCRALLGEDAADILVEMDPEGSFAGAFGQMNEDLGIGRQMIQIFLPPKRRFSKRASPTALLSAP